jgi:hypothetical protein
MLDPDTHKDEGGPEPCVNKIVEWRKLEPSVGDP